MTEVKSNKFYDIEFKRQTIQLAQESGKKICEIENELGLYEGAIRSWRRTLKMVSPTVYSNTGNLKPEEEELRRLRRENVILRQERDILKKAAAILAKNPSIGLD